jgi:hypothetical protein
LPPRLSASTAHLTSGFGRSCTLPPISELHPDHLMEKMAFHFGAEGAVGNGDFLN